MKKTLLIIFAVFLSVSCFALKFEIQINEETQKKELIAYDGHDSNIKIWEGVQHICSGVFDNNKKIKEISLPKTLETFADDLFLNLAYLDKISVNTLNDNYISIKDILYSKDKKTICIYPQAIRNHTFPVPNTVEKIGPYCFGNCQFLSKISLQDNVKTIEKGAFYNCQNIKELYIPKSIEKIHPTAFDNSKINALYFDETDFNKVVNLVKDITSKNLNIIYYKDSNNKYIYSYFYEIKRNYVNNEVSEFGSENSGSDNSGFDLDF